MGWDERQHKLLQAMGVRLWSPPTEPTGDAVTAADVLDGPTAWSGPAAVLEAGPVTAPVPAAMLGRERLPARESPPVKTPMLEPEPAPAALQRSAPHWAGAVAALDWPALQVAVAGCTACALSNSRTQTVFGVGNQQAHWMIVGEAPGAEEDLQGEPFVGKSGQLLDNMLAAIGLSRGGDDPARQVYIANVLKCRPPANRNPRADEAAQCEPFLRRQIELVQPKIILAMGRFAVDSLLQSDAAIGKLRGRVHQVGGVPTVVTYHPAYLLRNLTDKARAWDDLCLAKATLGQRF